MRDTISLSWMMSVATAAMRIDRRIARITSTRSRYPLLASSGKVAA
ncbi:MULTISPECIES: hypothetical protein [Burkholderia]|nr:MULTISPECIES: hypothetical protein [Burkholderia]